ncbi:MAG TPA: glycosyltransferase family A protein [Caulobacteraceae bacterium]|nr:glycosyltransferase family A protein [Caulobacteraceae bacterium]
MSEPLVSVITPTRNRAALLVETLDSVARQTLAHWEHVVVDDGSEDGTAEMIAGRRQVDPRLRYIVRDCAPQGANSCRNIGVRAARAPFVVLLDSDDLLAPNCLERRVQVMSQNADLDFATFQAGIFETAPGDLDGSANPGLLGDDLCRFLYFETPWQTTAPIWRRESLLRLGLFDEALLSWQDIELHVRAITAGCRYLRFAEIDYFFRYADEPTRISVEQRRSPRHLERAPEVLERLEAHVRGGPGMDWVRQRALCSLYFFIAERWVERGDLGPALSTWRRIRERRLGPPALHAAGSTLLRLQASRWPVGRLIHKWKGWTRLRTNPELVSR